MLWEENECGGPWGVSATLMHIRGVPACVLLHAVLIEASGPLHRGQLVDGKPGQGLLYEGVGIAPAWKTICGFSGPTDQFLRKLKQDFWRLRGHKIVRGAFAGCFAT